MNLEQSRSQKLLSLFYYALRVSQSASLNLTIRLCRKWESGWFQYIFKRFRLCSLIEIINDTRTGKILGVSFYGVT